MPFPLKRPNPETPVTEAENIGYGEDGNVKDALDQSTKTLTNQIDSDFDISDESNNVILRLKGGELQTKKFSSRDTPKQVDIERLYKFAIADENGNILAIFDRGHIKVKNFDSEVDGQVSVLDNSWSDLNIEDDNGNIVLCLKSGHVVTKNFNSATDSQTSVYEGSLADLDISDSQGNVLLRILNGHIVTKNFNSANINDDTTKLPDYWKTYLDNKKEELLAADLALGQHGVAFFFPTDVHWADNAKMSPEIIKHIMSFTSVKDVICGGDMIAAHGARNTKLDEMRGWIDAVKGINCINMLGNHDCNTSDQTTSKTSYLDDAKTIFPEEIYRMANSQTERDVVYTYNTNIDTYDDNLPEFNEYYGFVDNVSQKVRYIFLDSGAVHKPRWSTDNLRLSSQQIAWLQARINELETGWSVIVFTHIFFRSTKTTPYISLIGDQIIAALDAIYDTCNATIVGVIAGHVHASYSYVTPTHGYPVIASTTDAYLQAVNTAIETDTRVKGTSTEQAFDIYYVNLTNRTINTIRIGSGDTVMNRTFNF